MSDILWKSLPIGTAILGVALLSATSAFAAPTPNAEVFNGQSAQIKTSKSNLVALTPNSIKSTKLALLPSSPKVVDTKTPSQIGLSPALKLEQFKVEVPSQANATPKPLVIAEKPSSQPTPEATTPASTNVIDQVVRYGKEGNGSQDDSIGQVTSVSQLRDVQPTDWAFQALQSLVERYGVIAGYPDGTFRGNRALTRYEFAAGLNAALDRVNELISSGSTNLVRKEDIATLQRLQQEFSTELVALRGRVDNLEAQTAQLEANQFSTTTKLVGEAIFNITDEFNAPYKTNTVFQDRIRLDFQSSFTGRDTLHTRIAATNAQTLTYPGNVFGTSEGVQVPSLAPNLAASGGANNAVGLDWASYYFPVGPAQVYVAAFGGLHSDYAPTTSPYFDGFTGGTGSLTQFAAENPIYSIGGGTGIGINLPFGKPGTLLGTSSISLGYFAQNANVPLGYSNALATKANGGSGLFDGSYAALGQLNFNLGDRFAIGATFVHGYFVSGNSIFNLGSPGTGGVSGTLQANNPSTVLAGLGLGGNRAVVSNSYGGEAAFRLTKGISINGFVEETNARILGTGDTNIWSYGLGIAFPDLGKQGSVLGLFAGVEPTLRGLRTGGTQRNFGSRDNAYHAEGFYKYQLNDNISITPGIIVLFDPAQNRNNPDAVIGTLRTTFTF